MCRTAGAACGGRRGQEALLERVLFPADGPPGGTFPFLPELGSRLWQLGQLSAAQRRARRRQYVAEALAAEPGLSVEQVRFEELAGGRAQVTAELIFPG